MVSRCALLILCGFVLGLEFILEQPASSIMFSHPRLCQVQKFAASGGLRATRLVWTWMGAHGAPTPKPTLLLGTPSWLPGLKKTLCRADFAKARDTNVVVYSEGSKGQVRYTGSSGLKETQAYPRGYGRATAKLIRAAVVDVDSDSDPDFNYPIFSVEADAFLSGGSEQWSDADVGSVWPIVYRSF
jgi:hypothetical protein